MKRRVIYNNDFETVIWGNEPQSAEELAALIQRVANTQVTTYAIKVVEYDNKNYYVGNKAGIDWTTIDFESYGAAAYAKMARFLRELDNEGRPAFQIYVDSCREMGIECIAAFRMNDWHGRLPLTAENAGIKSANISLWLKEHPQYALQEPVTGEALQLADYSHAAVREYRLAVLKEIMEDFDFDGVELDFMRTPILFAPDRFIASYGYIGKERFPELSPILTDFVCEVREFLDDLARRKGKESMCLGLRVPETPEITRAVGIDLPAWIRKARVDYICPSGYHSTHFNIPVEQFKALCEGTDCGVYPSLFPNVSHGPAVLRTSQTEVYAAAAANYYAGGAEGVSFYNHFHPAIDRVGLSFNTEALTVTGSAQSVANFKKHHFYIVYSVEPPQWPDVAKLGFCGYRGTHVSNYGRSIFYFKFPYDLASADRRLERLRFKVFDAAPGDELRVDLNGVPVPSTTQWRQRRMRGNILADSRFGWESGRDIELLAGEPISEADKSKILNILATPYSRRSEVADPEQGSGRHVFMLVEVQMPESATALRRGNNALGVKVTKRRDDAVFDLYMGELEIVTARN